MIGDELLPIVGDVVEGLEVAEIEVGEEAGGEVLAGIDQRDIDLAIGILGDVAGSRGTAGAAAHDDDTGPPLRPQIGRHGERGRTRAQERAEMAPVDMCLELVRHGEPPNLLPAVIDERQRCSRSVKWAASAAISSSESRAAVVRITSLVRIFSRYSIMARTK